MSNNFCASFNGMDKEFKPLVVLPSSLLSAERKESPGSLKLFLNETNTQGACLPEPPACTPSPFLARFSTQLYLAPVHCSGNVTSSLFWYFQ